MVLYIVVHLVQSAHRPSDGHGEFRREMCSTEILRGACYFFLPRVRSERPRHRGMSADILFRRVPGWYGCYASLETTFGSYSEIFKGFRGRQGSTGRSPVKGRRGKHGTISLCKTGVEMDRRRRLRQKSSATEHANNYNIVKQSVDKTRTRALIAARNAHTAGTRVYTGICFEG